MTEDKKTQPRQPRSLLTTWKKPKMRSNES